MATWKHCAGNWVYPRACGGAICSGISIGLAVGVSPRVRGSRRHGEHGANDDGCIPARAGEPLCIFYTIFSKSRLLLSKIPSCYGVDNRVRPLGEKYSIDFNNDSGRGP